MEQSQSFAPFTIERRIQRELEALIKDPVPYCTAGPSGSDLYRWIAVFTGPDGTLYEGGTFFVRMLLSHNYPFSPPEVQFLTRFYHCNVNSMGHVCLPLLRNSERPSVSHTSMMSSQTSETSLTASSHSTRPVFASQLTSAPVFRNVSLSAAPAEHMFLTRQNTLTPEPISSPTTPLSSQPALYPLPSSQTSSSSAGIQSSALRWAPSLGIRSILYGLLNLFYECNPDDPLVASVAKQYSERRQQHDATARLWTRVFASQLPPPTFSREGHNDDADTEDTTPSVKRSRPEVGGLHLQISHF